MLWCRDRVDHEYRVGMLNFNPMLGIVVYEKRF